MILLTAVGVGLTVVLALALVVPLHPLTRLAVAVAASAAVSAALGERGWWIPATALAGGGFASLAVSLWELVMLGADTLRAALTRPRR